MSAPKREQFINLDLLRMARASAVEAARQETLTECHNIVSRMYQDARRDDLPGHTLLFKAAEAIGKLK